MLHRVFGLRVLGGGAHARLGWRSAASWTWVADRGGTCKKITLSWCFRHTQMNAVGRPRPIGVNEAMDENACLPGPLCRSDG